MDKFGLLFEFFTGSFGIVLKTVNTRHLMLRILVIWKLTPMRNNGLLQTIDRWQWCFLCVFEAGFEDVLEDIQRIYFTAVNGKSSTAI